MGLKIESVSNQSSTPVKTNLTLSPATADDNELSTLLSGSGSLKTTTENQREIGEIPAEKSDSALKEIGLNCLPALSSTLVFYGFSKNPKTLIAGLVAMGVSNLVSFLKDKPTAKA